MVENRVASSEEKPPNGKENCFVENKPKWFGFAVVPKVMKKKIIQSGNEI